MTVRRSLAVAALLVGFAVAGQPVNMAHSVERLANGHTLIADGGMQSQPATARVVEVDSLGRMVWAYLGANLPWLHTARRLSNGNTLLSISNGNRVLEVDAAGDSVWGMASGLRYPNEAVRLSGGNTLITDRNNNRVIEVDSTGTILWTYPGLHRPHNGNRLADGNTLVCDSDSNAVVEVNPAGAVVWTYAAGLYWPRCAQRLPNGNTLIADCNNYRVIEVDSAGSVVWSYAESLNMVYSAVRLDNGRTLISDTRLPSGGKVFELDPAGNRVWRYPKTVPVLVETLWVVNPSSGCSLYVHIHRPAYASPESRQPGVVLVPGGNGFGSSYDQSGFADNIADDGFVVLHFDPDGRGRSSAYPENYCGYVHQDGMHECMRVLAQRDYVDTAKLGVFSQSYGVTMATGMIARYPAPRAKFLLDFEGPADRNQTCQDSGGHVPVPPDSESFWLEREAARFIRMLPCYYLRMQTAQDHNPRITDNRHCIALVDSATSIQHGGSGISSWTRVNDSAMNPSNRTYTVSNPPAWIPEVQEPHNNVRHLLYLHEMADMPPLVGVEAGGERQEPRGGGLRLAANPLGPGRPCVVFGPGGGDLVVWDCTGRQVAACRAKALAPGVCRYEWDQRRTDGSAAGPGCYWLKTDGSPAAKLVIAR